MKNWKRMLLLLMFCFCFVQTAAFAGTVRVEAKAAKEGLKKEKGRYFYYIDGKKVKKQWITLKQEGSEVKYRYYFGANGAAVAGKKSAGILIPAVCKIGGKIYGFDQNGRMIKGVYPIKGQLSLFGPGNGVYKAPASQILRRAAAGGQNATLLLTLLKKYEGDPISRDEFPDSCLGDGKDLVLYYSNFMVQLFTDRKGITTVVSVNATPQKNPPETEAPADDGKGDQGGKDDKETEKDETEETEPETEKKKKPAVKKRGLVEENGGYYFYQKDKTKLKLRWKWIQGFLYYFDQNGKAQTYSAALNGKIYVFDRKGRLLRGAGSRILTVGIRSYYVDASGCAITGWNVIGGKLYYADTRTGVLYRSRSYDGINFSDSCAAENTVAARLKMKTMSILSSITNSSMSRDQKLRACWNYVVGGRFSYGSRYPNLNQSGWQKETALHMFENRWGNCYSFACAFAALAKEIGYSPYVLCGRVSGSRDGAADGMTRHAWVQINGAYYDPEAEYAGWYRGVYGAGGYYVAHQIQKKVAF